MPGKPHLVDRASDEEKYARGYDPIADTTMRKLRMGLIAGGSGSWTGRIHRIAAKLEGEIELVCGAFSYEPQESKIAGAALRLDPRRVYASYAEMIMTEALQPAQWRMDFVAIAMRDHEHYAPARMALEHGFHVVVDEPMAFSLAEAKSLHATVEKNGRVLTVTYTHSGCTMASLHDDEAGPRHGALQ